MTETAGFWTGLGEAASVDWCEPNYVHTHYVAELFNTSTSFLMLLMGLYGMWRSLQLGEGRELRHVLGFFSLALVGFGSMAFHGTLLRVSQALDELPMIYCSLALTFCLIERKGDNPKRRSRWALGLTLYALGFTVAYLTLKDYFVFFIFTYAAIVAWLGIASLKLAFGAQGDRISRGLVLSAVALFGSGVGLFWMPEHVFLACDHPLQAMHLHAIFHVLAGLGTYIWIVYVVYDRLRCREMEPEVMIEAPLPYVGLNDRPEP